MKVPLTWIKDYVNLKHNPKDFGNIMTDIEFMQDGPIVKVGTQSVIDLEVRQNRPDVLSILGAVREYAAFTSQKVKYPKEADVKIKGESHGTLVGYDKTKVVKRFSAIQINNVEIKPSPKYIQENLRAYGIEPINNIVDITNYVMLEYGIPMHAFDFDQLPKATKNLGGLINFRYAKDGEEFTTWQGTKVNLDKNDLVVVDSNDRLISIGAITGETKSGISNFTKNIVLEAANYYHAAIRKTAAKTNVHTESSLRHSKLLSSELVEVAMKRATYLVQELAGGKIEKVEDYYPQKEKQNTAKLRLEKIEYLAGIKVKKDLAVKILKNLEFDILKANDKEISVKIPIHRTDINYEEDLVEEVLRIWGYENIPTHEIKSAPPKDITPKELILEDRIRDVLVNLGGYEHITESLLEFSNAKGQIKLENPLNQEKNALRTSLVQTLQDPVNVLKKVRHKKYKVFEVGKTYYKEKDTYVESRQTTVVYSGFKIEDLKADFTQVLRKLGIDTYNTKFDADKAVLEYYNANNLIAEVAETYFTLFVDKILQIVDINKVPYLLFNTVLAQKIEEPITFNIPKDTNLEQVKSTIVKSSTYVVNAYVDNVYKNAYTFIVVFEDPKNSLTRKKINDIRDKFIASLKKQDISLKK